MKREAEITRVHRAYMQWKTREETGGQGTTQVCPLCRARINCCMCPVCLYTGEWCCNATTYYQWERAVKLGEAEEAKTHAAAMVSLLLAIWNDMAGSGRLG